MSNYNNVGARFEIIGRIMSGTSVTGYMIRDLYSGEVGTFDKSTTEQLALGKQIYNCSAQVYNQIINLKGINCKISKMPRYDENGNIIDEHNKQPKKIIPDLRLVGKVQNGRVVTNYILSPISNPNERIEKSKEETLELAKNGRIVNVKSQMNGGEAMLRGAQGFNMSKLQTYQVHSMKQS